MIRHLCSRRQGLFPESEISRESFFVKTVGPNLTPQENPRCGHFVHLVHWHFRDMAMEPCGDFDLVFFLHLTWIAYKTHWHGIADEFSGLI